MSTYTHEEALADCERDAQQTEVTRRRPTAEIAGVEYLLQRDRQARQLAPLSPHARAMHIAWHRLWRADQITCSRHAPRPTNGNGLVWDNDIRAWRAPIVPPPRSIEPLPDDLASAPSPDVSDLCHALGDELANILASGATQADAALLLGVSLRTIERRVRAARVGGHQPVLQFIPLTKRDHTPTLPTIAPQECPALPDTCYRDDGAICFTFGKPTLTLSQVGYPQRLDRDRQREQAAAYRDIGRTARAEVYASQARELATSRGIPVPRC